MRKKSIFILAVFLIFTCCQMAFAMPQVTDTNVKVYDAAGLFTPEETEALNEKARQTAEEWQMDAVILTTNDMEGKESRYYAAEFYDNNGFGYGEEKDGIILLLNMEDREIYLVSSGKGMDVFTDYYIEQILDDVIYSLGEGDYAGASSLFLDDVAYYCNHYTQYQEDPEHFTSDYEQAMGITKTSVWQDLFINILICAGLAAVFAGIFLQAMRRQYYMVKPAGNGKNYIVQNSLSLADQTDRFITSQRTAVPIPKNNHSSRGGSRGGSYGGRTTTFRSGGRSHGGGGRRF